MGLGVGSSGFRMNGWKDFIVEDSSVPEIQGFFGLGFSLTSLPPQALELKLEVPASEPSTHTWRCQRQIQDEFQPVSSKVLCAGGALVTK